MLNSMKSARKTFVRRLMLLFTIMAASPVVCHALFLICKLLFFPCPSELLRGSVARAFCVVKTSGGGWLVTVGVGGSIQSPGAAEPRWSAKQMVKIDFRRAARYSDRGCYRDQAGLADRNGCL